MADSVTAEIEDLKKKLSQNPDSLVFVPLADAYRKAGMLEEAIDVIKKGLEKHQSYASARVVLGRIYSEKNMLDEAIDEFKKVEAIDSNNIMVHSMLGNVFLKKKMYAQAIEQFQRVLSLNPEDTETQDKLQEALAAKQEPAAKEAVKTPPPPVTKPAAPPPAKPAAPEPAAAAKPAAPAPPKIDSQKNMKVAELYTKKEEFDKAIEVYRELLEADPENLIVQQRLREVYDLQEKKLNKQKEKALPLKGRVIEAEKITTEDILDVMKEAVEDDSVEEEAKAPAPVKPAAGAAPAKPAEKPAAEAAPAKPAEKPAAEAAPAKPAEKPAAEAAPAKPAEKPAAEAAPAKPAVIGADKAKEIEKVIKGLADVEGMVASFFLQKDGVLVASVVAGKINDPDISKAIAQIVNKTEQSVKNMKQGVLKQVAITTESGVLMFTEISSGVIFMAGNEKINVGKMSLVLKEVISNVKKITG